MANYDIMSRDKITHLSCEVLLLPVEDEIHRVDTSQRNEENQSIVDHPV